MTTFPSILPTFRLEEYLQQYEFSAPYQFCNSDPESFSLAEILERADSETRALWDELRLGYTEVCGHPLLRKEIASIYSPLGAEKVLTFAGAEEAIYCAFRALLGPGDHVITFSPCYQSLLEVPIATGASVTSIPLKETNGWQLDFDEIAAALRPNTRMIVVNFPHNPTGALLSVGEANRLVELARVHDLMIFSDEVYRLLGPSTTELWAPPLSTLYDKALSLGVMSKAFGMAGLRVGWLTCENEEILDRLQKYKHYLSICNSCLSEIVSLITLRAKSEILQRNRSIVDQNLPLLDSAIAESDGALSWVRPGGGCVGFVRIEVAGGVDLFAHRLVDETGVLIMPARIFDFPGNYFRVGFGRRSMPQALERFLSFLERWQRS